MPWESVKAERKAKEKANKEDLTMNKVLVLASGGLDSSVLLALYSSLGYEVHTLYVNYGNKNSEEESDALFELCERFKIADSQRHEVSTELPWSKANLMTGDPETAEYIEMRNLILLSYAISLAEAKEIDKIVIGYIGGVTEYRDTSEAFLDDISVLAQRHVGIKIEAPLMNLNKTEVFRLGKKLGISLDDIFSCSTPKDGEPCGKCTSCQDILDLKRREQKGIV